MCQAYKSSAKLQLGRGISKEFFALSTAFDYMDFDNSRSVSFEEFTDLMKSVQPDISDQVIIFYYSILDENGSGELDLVDFLQLGDLLRLETRFESNSASDNGPTAEKESSKGAANSDGKGDNDEESQSKSKSPKEKSSSFNLRETAGHLLLKKKESLINLIDGFAFRVMCCSSHKGADQKRETLRTIASSNILRIGIVSFIAFHVCAQIVFLSMDLEYEPIFMAIDLFAITVFTTEVLLKIAAYGSREFVKSGWNRLDLVLVVMTMTAITLEILLQNDSSTMTAVDDGDRTGGGGLVSTVGPGLTFAPTGLPNSVQSNSRAGSADINNMRSRSVQSLKLVTLGRLIPLLGSLRNLRVFRSNQRLRVMSSVYLRVMGGAYRLSVLVFAVMYFFAVIGMEVLYSLLVSLHGLLLTYGFLQMFQGEFTGTTENPYAHFASFQGSMLALFQSMYSLWHSVSTYFRCLYLTCSLCIWLVLTGSDWHSILYTGISVAPSSSVYFILYMFITNLVLLSLLVAMVLDLYFVFSEHLHGKVRQFPLNDTFSSLQKLTFICFRFPSMFHIMASNARAHLAS